MRNKKRIWQVVFSMVAIGGVVATGVLTGKATIKAKQELDQSVENPDDISTKEKIERTWKIYAPAAGVAMLTISCIAGANILSYKQQASLIATYSLASKQLNAHQNEYKRIVKKLFGEDADERVEKEIAIEKRKDTHITAYGAITSSSLNADKDENIRLFYDRYSERYFEASLSKVIEAQYHLNRNFVLRGYSPVNEYYDFLGLDSIEDGDRVGWEIEDDLYWVDFDNQFMTMDDGLECCIVSFVTTPWIPETMLD